VIAMAERGRQRGEDGRHREREPEPILKIRDLHVFYGHSHALQDVNLTLDFGILSLVGRNGMGKTTLCNAIMGLVQPAQGSIRFDNEELRGLTSNQIANLGVGYVPQGRRLWPSLTVDEHLRLCHRGRRRASWTVERAYEAFPRLAERRSNYGGQLSGGEQQMLAIARALLGNRQLLIMDEPTEGLAPNIVSQVGDMLLALGEQEDISILLIEQNIGFATEVSEQVAIMVNGRINHVLDAAHLAADRDLQQRLLGVGRHGHEEAFEDDVAAGHEESARRDAEEGRVHISNPSLPTRWSPPFALAEITAASGSAAEDDVPEVLRQAPTARHEISGEAVLVVGTFDTKGRELKYLRDCVTHLGLKARTVDLSTSGKPSGADVPPNQIAAYHRRGSNAVFTGDRGEAVREMAQAFENWIVRQRDIAGIVSAGGSGGTALVTPGMRRLPIGLPKVMISTVASGDVKQYVGPSDIMMMYSVTDVQGLNSISRQVLANGAHAIGGMVANHDIARAVAAKRGQPLPDDLPAVGLTMFGVTTPCVQQVSAWLEAEFDCLVFHATGIGGQSMENLVESGLLEGVLDLTTTEVCDLLVGGVFAATEDRFGAVIRSRLPYVGSCGALDMVNFAARDTVPTRFQGRTFYEHNPQVTLMRTTAEENDRIGRWIGEKLNQMDGPVQFFLPEGGVSLLDAPGQPFHDPEADRTLFEALEETVRQTGKRRLIRLPHNINDPQFAEVVVGAFHSIVGRQALRGKLRR